MEKRGLERYSYSSGLTLPLLASDTPVLPAVLMRQTSFGLRFFGVGDGVQVPDLFRKSARKEKGGKFPHAVCENKRAEVDGVLVRKGNIF